MRVAVDTTDVQVDEAVLEAVGREVTERVGMPVFAGARDVRLRLRQAKGALLAIVAVGFSAGGLVTSSAESATPLEAITLAFDGLPERLERIKSSEQRGDVGASRHAAVRHELQRLLARS